ncbi:MAG: thioredoxin family protein [Pseudomonadota bacterium]
MIEFDPKTLEASLVQNNKVFLKLWKKGCGPCKMSEPAVNRLDAIWSKEVVFRQICISDYPEMLEIAGTEILPVFFAFHQHKLAGKLEGFKGIKNLEDFLEANLGPKPEAI